MYIELFGKEAQPDSIPRKVYLDVRHLSGSFFQAGDKTIKQFYQPVGSFRNIKFDRFTLSNEKKCKRRKEKGKKSGEYWNFVLVTSFALETLFSRQTHFISNYLQQKWQFFFNTT